MLAFLSSGQIVATMPDHFWPAGARSGPAIVRGFAGSCPAMAVRRCLGHDVEYVFVCVRALDVMTPISHGATAADCRDHMPEIKSVRD